MKFRSLLAVAVLLIGGPILADGGSPGDFELGIYAGYSLMDDWGQTPTALNLDDDLLFGVRAGWFFSSRLSIELSAQRLNTFTAFDPSLSINNRNTVIDSTRMNFLYNFRPEQSFRPFLTAGYGLASLDVNDLLKRDKSAINVGGGLRWYVSPKFGLRLDTKWIQTDIEDVLGTDPSDIEVTYGILWSFGGSGSQDSDGDGVSDRKDNCPDTPPSAKVDDRGCPLDGDKDDVFDGLDKCPDTPRGYSVDTSGCGLDRDGDGIADSGDLCPNTPSGARVDATGCPSDSDRDRVFDGIDKCPDTPRSAIVDPEGCPTDTDGDGVFDGADRCPETPADAEVDRRGCARDSDGDGISDGLDQCPNTVRGARVNTKGCEVLFETEAKHLVLEGVSFGFNSAELTGGTRTVLDRIARLLALNPDVRVEVAGHTDSKGNDAYNLQLSHRRATAVEKYLESKGIASSRVEAMGYGETDPIADNETAEGRDRNRRVTLRQLN